MLNRNSWRLLLIVVALLLPVLTTASAVAQYGRTAGASNASLGTLGLVRAWETQIEFDSTRGGLAGVTQHISSQSAQTVYDVNYPGGRITFSDRDLDPFREPLGAKGAKQKAQDWIAAWKRRSKSKEEPTIEEHVVPDVVLIATSDRGIVQCLNGETGRTLWTTKIGSVRHPTTGAAVNEKHVALINGTTLYLLDRADGHVIWERRTTHPAGAGPAMSESLIFVPMVNGNVEIFYTDEPRRPAANFHASGRCVVQPVVFRDAVAWPTDRGNLYVGNAEIPGIRFRITAGGAIHSAPTFRAGTDGNAGLVFFASEDGYVYSAEIIKGAIVSRFSAGESISSTPVVIQDKLYVVTDNGTLFCAGADDAQERWFVPGMKQFLAANLDRVYALDRKNRVMGFDAETGNPLGAASLGSLDYAFLNTQSDRMYVGTSTGVLQCLREQRQHYPLVHGGIEVKPDTAQPLQKPSEAEAKPAGGKPMEDNPFETDAATEKPMPKEPVDDNPFD